ncbi:hypothetical protein AAF712_010871 [Marasmius tenuissimus]|uniref:Uncharacterized protein n=1 Tax=Marasmius tenuissimus TaxID=585030 RepID=A0ABR2ZKM6_9AGAR
MAGEVKQINDTKFTGYILSSHPKGTTPFLLFNEEQAQKASHTFGDWLKHIRTASSATQASSSSIKPDVPEQQQQPSNPAEQMSSKTRRQWSKREGKSERKERAKELSAKESDGKTGRTKGQGRKKANNADSAKSDLDTNKSTDWSKVVEEESREESLDNEDGPEVEVNISPKEHAKLSYNERWEINIACKNQHLQTILKDIEKALPPTKRECEEKEKEARHKKRQHAIVEKAEQRGEPRRLSRLTQQTNNAGKHDLQTNTLLSVKAIKNTARSPDPLHWPEVYTMALEYVDNGTQETFPQFEEHLKALFVKFEVNYDYSLLKPLFTQMWAGETDTAAVRAGVCAVRDEFVDTCSNDDIPGPSSVNKPHNDGSKLPSPPDEPRSTIRNPANAANDSASSLTPHIPSHEPIPPSPSMPPLMLMPENENEMVMSSLLAKPPSPTLPLSSMRPTLDDDTSFISAGTGTNGSTLSSAPQIPFHEPIPPLPSVPPPIPMQEDKNKSGPSPSLTRSPSPTSPPSSTRPTPNNDTSSNTGSGDQLHAPVTITSIPTLPEYLKYGQRAIIAKDYSATVLKLQFPENYLLYLQNVPNLKRQQPEQWETVVLK